MYIIVYKTITSIHENTWPLKLVLILILCSVCMQTNLDFGSYPPVLTWVIVLRLCSVHADHRLLTVSVIPPSVSGSVLDLVDIADHGAY